MRFGLTRLRPMRPRDVEQLVLLVDVQVEGGAGQSVGPGGGVRTSWAPSCRPAASGRRVGSAPAPPARRVGHLLARPYPLHHRDTVGHAAHRLRGGVGADGLVVLAPAAHAEADGEPAAAEHVAGGQRLRQHHRVVQLRDEDGGHQLHPIRPRRQRPEQRQALRIVERHPLAPAQRRERPTVDQARPCLQRRRVEVRLHHRQGHPDMHVGDSGTPRGSGAQNDLTVRQRAGSLDARTGPGAGAANNPPPSPPRNVRNATRHQVPSSAT